MWLASVSVDKKSNVDRNRAHVDNNEYCKNDDTRHAVHPGGTAQHAPKKYVHLCLSLMWLATVSVDKNSNVDRNDLMLMKINMNLLLSTKVVFFQQDLYFDNNLSIVVLLWVWCQRKYNFVDLHARGSWQTIILIIVSINMNLLLSTKVTFLSTRPAFL